LEAPARGFAARLRAHRARPEGPRYRATRRSARDPVRPRSGGGGAGGAQLMGRRRRVRVPGSSANLGPGYDAMAAAVSVHLGLEAVAVIPAEQVPTVEARAAMPPEVPLADATFNVAHAAVLALGLARADLALIARGLQDRLHQPARERLYPRSMELVRRAPALGALGATISGAGPTVLFWVFFEQTGALVDRLREETAGWAEVQRLNFVALGADVAGL